MARGFIPDSAGAAICGPTPEWAAAATEHGHAAGGTTETATEGQPGLSAAEYERLDALRGRVRRGAVTESPATRPPPGRGHTMRRTRPIAEQFWGRPVVELLAGLPSGSRVRFANRLLACYASDWLATHRPGGIEVCRSDGAAPPRRAPDVQASGTAPVAANGTLGRGARPGMHGLRLGAAAGARVTLRPARRDSGPALPTAAPRCRRLDRARGQEPSAAVVQP
jgi:hypothetical protein